MAIRHLLTMTAPYKYRSEPWTRVCSSDDWIVAALDLLGGRAGLTGQFKYSTLGIHILTGILAKTSGMSTADFANQYLFTPLGIAPRTNYYVETAEEHKEFLLPETLTTEQYLEDAVGVTNYLRERFGQDKIYLMGHSFGTYIGILTASKRPELYHAYLAMSHPLLLQM